MDSKAGRAREPFPNLGGGEKTGKDLVEEFKFLLWDGDGRWSCSFQQEFTAVPVCWAPPGSSFWTLKLERACMPESEWWSLRLLPSTPRAYRRGGGGEGRRKQPRPVGFTGFF